MKRERVTNKQIAATMRVSTNTVRKWLTAPEKMPLVTLLEMSKVIGIRKRELLSAIERCGT